MNKQLLVITLSMVLAVPISTVFAQSANTGTSGHLTIPQTCGIAFVSGAPIEYGSLGNNAESLEQTLVIDNTGNTAGTLYVSGNDWYDPADPNIQNHLPPTSQMLVGQTHFNTLPAQGYSSNLALDTLITQLTPNGGFVPTVNLDTYWQVLVSLINPNYAGALQQNIIFTIDCGGPLQ